MFSFPQNPNVENTFTQFLSFKFLFPLVIYIFIPPCLWTYWWQENSETEFYFIYQHPPHLMFALCQLDAF